MLLEVELDCWEWRSIDWQTRMAGALGRPIIYRPRPAEQDSKDIERYDRGERVIDYTSQTQLVPLDIINELMPCRLIGVHGIPGAVAKLEQRVEPVMNERVKVVVPGPALLLYDAVQVLHDACTDHLQSQLYEGWRILAICVQPDQRRPDYVLGRVNPENP